MTAAAYELPGGGIVGVLVSVAVGGIGVFVGSGVIV